jgi:hypothetical protein
MWPEMLISNKLHHITLGSKLGAPTHQLLLQEGPLKIPYRLPHFFEESLALIEKTRHMRNKKE